MTGAALILMAAVLCAHGCSRPAARVDAHGSTSVAPTAADGHVGASTSAAPSKREAPPASPPQIATAPRAAPPAPAPIPPLPGGADLDPDNDAIVGPPELITDCEKLLRERGVDFALTKLPERKRRSGRSCGAPQAVIYKNLAGGARLAPTPIVTCGLALALTRFDVVLQEEAERTFGQRVVRVGHIGTYSCRDMARFDLVSEHSYANGIDFTEFVLKNGRKISIEAHFGRPSAEPSSKEGVFLRALARRLYDDNIFSCVLTEYFDPLHRNHFHVDLARYRVDGTR